MQLASRVEVRMLGAALHLLVNQPDEVEFLEEFSTREMKRFPSQKGCV